MKIWMLVPKPDNPDGFPDNPNRVRVPRMYLFSEHHFGRWVVTDVFVPDEIYPDPDRDPADGFASVRRIFSWSDLYPSAGYASVRRIQW